MEENLPPHTEFWFNVAKPDCFFLVGPETGPKERIGALKAILMAFSDPFKSMFGESDIAEKGYIHLVDVEPDTFKIFLKCIYGGSDQVIPKLNFEESAKLIYVVEKYLLNDIKTKLLSHLMSMVTPDNLFVALNHPVLFQIEDVYRKITSLLRAYFKIVLSHEEFLELSSDAIMRILESNEPYYVREIDIWNALVRWAKHKTQSSDGGGLRSEMFNFLKYIRFLSMDYREFCKDVLSTNILSKEEGCDISQSLGDGVSHKFNHISTERLPRYRIMKSENIITKFLRNDQDAFIICSVKTIPNPEYGHFFYSEVLEWSGKLWYLSMGIKNTSTPIMRQPYDFEIYLNCLGNKAGWKVKVYISATLVGRYINTSDHYTKHFSHLFYETNRSKCCLSYNFDKLFDVNTDSEYQRDNTIILTVQIIRRVKLII